MSGATPSPPVAEPPERGNPFVIPALILVAVLVLGGIVRAAILEQLGVGSEWAGVPGEVSFGPQPTWRTLPGVRSPWTCWFLGGSWHERSWRDDVGQHFSDARCLAEPGTRLEP